MTFLNYVCLCFFLNIRKLLSKNVKIEISDHYLTNVSGIRSVWMANIRIKGVRHLQHNKCSIPTPESVLTKPNWPSLINAMPTENAKLSKQSRDSVDGSKPNVNPIIISTRQVENVLI